VLLLQLVQPYLLMGLLQRRRQQQRQPQQQNLAQLLLLLPRLLFQPARPPGAV
jgi:hypothetical protein